MRSRNWRGALSAGGSAGDGEPVEVAGRLRNTLAEPVRRCGTEPGVLISHNTVPGDLADDGRFRAAGRPGLTSPPRLCTGDARMAGLGPAVSLAVPRPTHEEPGTRTTHDRAAPAGAVSKMPVRCAGRRSPNA